MEKLSGDQIEAEPKYKFFDLFKLSTGEREQLRQKIAESDGLVRIFVHPFFDRFNSPDTQRRQNEYDTGVRKIFESESSLKPPIIVMEQSQEIIKTKSLLTHDMKSSIYYISTRPVSSQPWRVDPEMNFSTYEDELRHQIDHQDEEWGMLMKLMHELGIKKILLGGMALVLRSPTKMSKEYGACVGGAKSNLENEFEVELSNLTMPHRRSD